MKTGFMNVSTVMQIVIIQFVLTTVLAFVALFFGWVIAYSVFLGGLTSAVPSAYMAFRIRRGTAHPDLALKQMMRGEKGKHAITFLMFVWVFLTVKPLAVAYFFTALGLGMACNIVVPLVIYRISENITE